MVKQRTILKEFLKRKGLKTGIEVENEKYKGDALLQKSYTVDFFTKKRAPSKGEIQMFYVEDDRMTTMLSFRSKYGNVFSLRLSTEKIP